MLHQNIEVGYTRRELHNGAVAGITEIHEMKMEKDVMKMAAVGVLPIAPGATVELKPGSYHVMLMDLKEPLKADSKLAMTLTFENDKGQKNGGYTGWVYNVGYARAMMQVALMELRKS